MNWEKANEITRAIYQYQEALEQYERAKSASEAFSAFSKYFDGEQILLVRPYCVEKDTGIALSAIKTSLQSTRKYWNESLCDAEIALAKLGVDFKEIAASQTVCHILDH